MKVFIINNFLEKKTLVFGLNGTLAYISLTQDEEYDIKIDKPTLGTTYYIKFRP